MEQVLAIGVSVPQARKELGGTGAFLGRCPKRVQLHLPRCS
jgi:hypothetical protein